MSLSTHVNITFQKPPILYENTYSTGSFKTSSISNSACSVCLFNYIFRDDCLFLNRQAIVHIVKGSYGMLRIGLVVFAEILPGYFSRCQMLVY